MQRAAAWMAALNPAYLSGYCSGKDKTSSVLQAL